MRSVRLWMVELIRGKLADLFQILISTRNDGLISDRPSNIAKLAKAK